MPLCVSRIQAEAFLTTSITWSSTSAVIGTSSKSQSELLLTVAKSLRSQHADAYIKLADSIEDEFNLAMQGIDASCLGEIDTFRFEERALLEYAGQLIFDGKFEEAIKVIDHRRVSF